MICVYGMSKTSSSTALRSGTAAQSIRLPEMSSARAYGLGAPVSATAFASDFSALVTASTDALRCFAPDGAFRVLVVVAIMIPSWSSTKTGRPPRRAIVRRGEERAEGEVDTRDGIPLAGHVRMPASGL